MFTRILIITMLVATACTSNPIQSSAPPQNILESTENDSSDPTAIPSLVAEDGLQKKLTQLVIDDLATHLSVDVEVIRVISTEPIAWPNAALGCPQLGFMYAQVLTSGFLVRLEAMGQVYEYHTDTEGTMILCDSPSEDNSPTKDVDKNIDDGWPNETKDKDVIIATPARQK